MKILKTRDLKNTIRGGFIIPWRQEVIRALRARAYEKAKTKEEKELLLGSLRNGPKGSEFLGKT